MGLGAPMRMRMSQHAVRQVRDRRIPLATLEKVLDEPDQVTIEHGGRKAYQSIVDLGRGHRLLLRAIVDDRVEPPVVVTVYATKRIAKYWRPT